MIYTGGGGTSTTFYYVLNAQGDVVKLINAYGTVYASYSYDAWGKPLTAQSYNSSFPYLHAINPLRYRGYYYDTETGWYYLQSRYYDPILKRFLNADTYASTGQGFLGYNMFAYCGNNPVNASDPSGSRSILEHDCGGGVTGYTDAGTCGPSVYNAGNEVSVTINHNSIVFDVFLNIRGAIPAQYLADGIRANWEGTYDIWGAERNVKLNLHNGLSPNGKTITVYTYDMNGRSNATSTFKGAETAVVRIYTRYESGKGKDAGWSMAHELGHCFGIEDYYTHVDAGEPGFYRSYNSIMNYGYHHAGAQDILLAIAALNSGSWQLWEVG